MPPTITGCPSNIEQNTDVNSAMAVVTWSEPVETDDLGNPNMTSDVASGSAFGIGTTPVTYTAIDSASQTTTCTFNVVIRGKSSKPNDQLTHFVCLYVCLFVKSMKLIECARQDF